MYNVVPAVRRAQVLAFQDGVPGQVGTALSGVLLLAAGAPARARPVLLAGPRDGADPCRSRDRDPAALRRQPAQDPALGRGRAGPRGRAGARDPRRGRRRPGRAGRPPSPRRNRRRGRWRRRCWRARRRPMRGRRWPGRSATTTPASAGSPRRSLLARRGRPVRDPAAEAVARRADPGRRRRTRRRRPGARAARANAAGRPRRGVPRGRFARRSSLGDGDPGTAGRCDASPPGSSAASTTRP